MRTGGVAGWTQAAGIAAVAGSPLSTHLHPEGGAHVMRVSERPGLGLSRDATGIERFRFS